MILSEGQITIEIEQPIKWLRHQNAKSAHLSGPARRTPQSDPPFDHLISELPEAAHAWLEVNREYRCATCALTEIAFVRVLSNPAYRDHGTTVEDAVLRLRTFCSEQEHEFWPDSVSLLDGLNLAKVEMSAM